VDVETRREGGFDERTGGQPGGRKVGELGEELLAGDFRGGLEFGLG